MKIYRLSGKTWRDKVKKQFITLYHISPERLTKLMPRSKLLKTGKIGLFMSPSYKSTIQDWAHYVMGKKHQQHPLSVQRSELYSEQQKLKEEQGKNPTLERQSKIDEIEEKLNRIFETTKIENKAYYDSIKGYKKLYLHTIQCPREIYKESEKMMQEAYDSDPVKSFGFWSWGSQTFIEAQNLPQLNIINVKELNTSEFMDEYHNLSFKRFLDTPSKLVGKQVEREQQEWKANQEAKRAKIPPNPNRYDYKKEQEQRRKEYEEYWAKNPLK